MKEQMQSTFVSSSFAPCPVQALFGNYALSVGCRFRCLGSRRHAHVVPCGVALLS